jgi:hypothetical protein
MAVGLGQYLVASMEQHWEIVMVDLMESQSVGRKVGSSVGMKDNV